MKVRPVASRIAFGSAVALALALSVTDARAADAESEQAHVIFERAREAFAKGSFASAAELFEESASHVLHPAPLVNAADAWERAGDYVRVARACDRLLAIPSLDSSIRAQTETRLSRALPHVATLELEGAAGTVVRIDEGAEAKLPLRMRLPPGPHRIGVRGGGDAGADPARIDIVLDPGATTRRTIGARERGSAEGPPLEPPNEKSRGLRGPPAISWVSFGVAALALGGGAYFGNATLDARSRWIETADPDARSDFYRDRALTNVSFGIAIVGAAVGTVLWLTAQ